jgi:hypothetical protein
MRKVEQDHMSDLITSAWGIPFFMTSLNYHAQWFFSVRRPLCHLGRAFTSRTGHSETHYGTQTSLIFASHPDYLISGGGTSRLAREI